MQIVTLTFPFSLHPGDIPKLRAAIIGCLGTGHHLFNGFDNSEQGVEKYSNAYPLVEYSVYKGKARIQGIGTGADAILRYLLTALPDDLLIGERYCRTTDFKLEVSTWTPELLPEQFTFGLYQYLPLNKKNYKAWKALEGNEPARLELLGSCLTGHLRALAETADPNLDRKQIEARILSVDKVKMTRWHGNQFVTFNLVACANFIPPFGLGVGRCHSFGFGEVCGKERYARLSASRRQSKKEVASTITK
ncbi:CRISPR-associated endonuclease Cas6 [Neolewinella agarilytica]|uniref:Uncharacterized protein n=1 Tax=Neolewinella agarilytica TaxID=478744 RepID=A0A1H9HCF3_9BACT|nr:CRISPR-associated endonuclease Cas6 [Neolewinella agarilytica]SEQ59994.1 hypothetical protein SAMN05444359_112103 [Neolewinella agarilytica]